MSDKASRDLLIGCEYPYHQERTEQSYVPVDWCERAVLGILRDLSDRAGIKHEIGAVDMDVRAEIVEHLSDIVRTAFNDTKEQ